MEIRLNEVKLLDKLKNEDVNFWRDLMKKYLVDGPSVAVRGIPSKKEQKRLEEEDAARVAERVKMFGDDGLAKKDKELMDAIDANEVNHFYFRICSFYFDSILKTIKYVNLLFAIHFSFSCNNKKKQLLNFTWDLWLGLRRNCLKVHSSH